MYSIIQLLESLFVSVVELLLEVVELNWDEAVPEVEELFVDNVVVVAAVVVVVTIWLMLRFFVAKKISNFKNWLMEIDLNQLS